MNTPDNCYLDKGHSAHDLLGPGEVCKACGFVAPAPDPTHLVGEFDAWKWADEFVRIHGGDKDLMVTWFANAIMAGYDHARREPPSSTPPEPTQQDYFNAAQCWCDPTTSTLVMEPMLAVVIARSIARARHAGEVAERERILSELPGLLMEAALAGHMLTTSEVAEATRFNTDDVRPTLEAIIARAAIRSLAPAEKETDR
ncbi:MAG TPA: hypothetical protein VNM39_10830 [Verrucomicrobiae bacterium]|nr:hypothetical protein [Verrucomicrobiae bacterium]